jgi:serine/threonine-protein kinase RsbW
MNARADLELTAPAEPESLELVHSLLGEFWTLSEDIGLHERIRFETAIMEIANNIAEYAGTDEFTLVLTDTGGEIEALFRDAGPPIAFDPTRRQLPDDMAESGRGIALACAAVDEVHYSHENHQNLWRLTLRRHAEHTRGAAP